MPIEGQPTGGGEPTEHQNAENTAVGSESEGSRNSIADYLAPDAIILSQTITTTKRCCIVVVTEVGLAATDQQTQIKRGGVDKTKETTVSAMDYSLKGLYGQLQYSSEVLDAGTYQYDLVMAPWVESQPVWGRVMKIIAVSSG